VTRRYLAGLAFMAASVVAIDGMAPWRVCLALFAAGLAFTIPAFRKDIAQ
jgi:hypothetical protein